MKTLATAALAVIALADFFLQIRVLPETKGRSLEELEKQLVRA